MPRKAAFIYDDAMSRHVLRDDHPLKATRLRYTYDLLDAYDAFSRENSDLIQPRPATDAEILTVHASEYLEAVKSFSTGLRMETQPLFNFGSGGDNPAYPGMYDAACLSTGASLVAARMVADGEADVAFNISGGLHHAAPAHASGFWRLQRPRRSHPIPALPWHESPLRGHRRPPRRRRAKHLLPLRPGTHHLHPRIGAASSSRGQATSRNPARATAKATPSTSPSSPTPATTFTSGPSASWCPRWLKPSSPTCW